MRTQSVRAKWIGVFFFAFGAGIGLYLTGAMTWGEIEASLAVTPGDSKSLALSCPLMMSHNETGVVEAEIVNEIDKEVEPLVTASFGHSETPSRRRVSRTYILAPWETQYLQWEVDASDAAFGRIIPVAVIQSRYNLNPPRWGICGILLFSLFGLNGMRTLSLIIGISVLSMIFGILLCRPYFTSVDSPKKFAQMGITLASLTSLALISSVFRLWGLTALLDTLSLILLGTLATELVLPQRAAADE